MSGHSKWSTIKHKKAALDAKRGKAFSKIIKEVTVAARIGGGDLAANPRLRTAIAAAKAENMPKENIERAIKKGTGELEGVNYEEVTYEGYGPGGVAILVETISDNRQRTVADVRHLFAKRGGNLGEPVKDELEDINFVRSSDPQEGHFTSSWLGNTNISLTFPQASHRYS